MDAWGFGRVNPACHPGSSPLFASPFSTAWINFVFESATGSTRTRRRRSLSPESSVDEAVQATMRALSPSATPTAFPHPYARTLPPEADTPTHANRNLPASVRLDGMKFFTQRGLWNYCAPSNLAMALSFWGWEGKQTDVGPYVKPFDKDKNVVPPLMSWGIMWLNIPICGQLFAPEERQQS